MAEKPIPIPEGLDVQQRGAEVIIRRRWYTHTVWFLLFFCVAWDSFLVFWYSMALGNGNPGPMNWLMIVFPIAHVAVGIGLTYSVLCTFFNVTDVILSTSHLRVHTGPLPWRGDCMIQASELTGFSHQNRHSGNRNNTMNFDIMYVDSTNHEKTLIRGLATQEQARYLTMALRRFYLSEAAPESPSLGKWGNS